MSIKPDILKSTSYKLPSSLIMAVRRKSLELTEKTGQRVTANAIVEQAIRKLLGIKKIK